MLNREQLPLEMLKRIATDMGFVMHSGNRDDYIDYILHRTLSENIQDTHILPSSFISKSEPELTPFDEKEEEIMTHLSEAYNKFIKLSEDHPNHHQEFCFGIHQLQRMVMSRALRRIFPKYFNAK